MKNCSLNFSAESAKSLRLQLGLTQQQMADWYLDWADDVDATIEEGNAAAAKNSADV